MLEAIARLRESAQDAFNGGRHKQAFAEMNEARKLAEQLSNPQAKQQELSSCIVKIANWFTMMRSLTDPEAAALYRMAIEVCGLEHLGLVLFEVSQFALQGGNIESALGYAHTIREHTLQGPESELIAALVTGTPLIFLGRLSEADEEFLQAEALLPNIDTLPELIQEKSHPNVHIPGLRSLIHGYGGKLESGLKLANQSFAAARKLESPYHTYLALVFRHTIHKFREEYDQVLKLTEAVRELAERFAIPYWAWVSEIDRGFVMVQRGRVDQGIEIMEAAGKELEQLGAKLVLTSYYLHMAEAELERGRTLAARQHLETGLESATERGELLYQPEFHRLLGQVHSAIGDFEQAESHFESALGLAGNHGSRLFELRAMASFAQMMLRGGQHDEARSRLGSVVEFIPGDEDSPYVRKIRDFHESI